MLAENMNENANHFTKHKNKNVQNERDNRKRHIKQYDRKRSDISEIKDKYFDPELCNSTTNVLKRKKPAVYTDDCDSYFKNALETLKSGIDDEQKEVFFTNVLEKTKGQELQLSCQSVSSRCIEILLEAASDLSEVIRFMRAFSESKEDACGNMFASHITEHLLYLGLRHLTNWSQDIDPSTESEESCLKKEQILEVLTWIYSFAEFCLENLKTCLDDVQASPVLRTLIHALGGYYVSQAVNQSKRAKQQKKVFEDEYLGSNNASKEKESISLNDVPKFFVDILKKLAKSFLKLDNIKGYAIEPGTSTVLQSFLYVLKRRLPKHSKKFVQAIGLVLFEDKNNDGIPLALLHKNCSFVVEKVFESALESQQEEIWNNHISEHLDKLVLHNVGNYVVQRLFDVVETKDLFETISKPILELFPQILRTGNFGIFLSLASACIKMKTQQAAFMTHLMQCLHCATPEERQVQLVPVLLGFEMYEDYMRQKKTRSEDDLKIILQGSLLIQSILKFQKPVKVVQSILALKPEELKYITCHIQGCHVLTAFLDSANVGEKNKDKFLKKLKPALQSISTDFNGSLTLSRMWVLLTLKQKGALVQDLLEVEKVIKDSHSGSMILKKFGVYHYKSRYEQWKTFQENLSKKRKQGS